MLHAHFNAPGCPRVVLTPQDARALTNTFITVLATTVGVSRQDLLPPNGVCQCL